MSAAACSCRRRLHQADRTTWDTEMIWSHLRKPPHKQTPDPRNLRRPREAPPTHDSNPWLSRSGADGQTNIFKQLAGGCCWFSIGSTCSFAKWAQTLERDNTVELIERLSLMCDLAAHWTCDWRGDNQRFRVRGWSEGVWGLLPFCAHKSKVCTNVYLEGR